MQPIVRRFFFSAAFAAVLAAGTCTQPSHQPSAAVEAVIQGERHRAQRTIRLEPMRINGAATFGGLVSLAQNDRYHVDVLVRLPGNEREIRSQFLFDARGLAASRN